MKLKLSEAAFQESVVELAWANSWKVVHIPTVQTAKGDHRTVVRYDGTGFPDLLLIHPTHGVVVFAELKIPPNKLSDRQQDWADWLEAADRASAPYTKYFVWTPASMDALARYLANPLDFENVG